MPGRYSSIVNFILIIVNGLASIVFGCVAHDFFYELHYPPSTIIALATCCAACAINAIFNAVAFSVYQSE